MFFFGLSMYLSLKLLSELSAFIINLIYFINKYFCKRFIMYRVFSYIYIYIYIYIYKYIYINIYIYIYINIYIYSCVSMCVFISIYKSNEFMNVQWGVTICNYLC